MSRSFLISWLFRLVAGVPGTGRSGLRLGGMGVQAARAAPRKASAMTIRTIQFLAIIVSALALIPAGAHLAALPNKINMPQSAYFSVQGIYYGWAILGLL